MTTHQTPPGVIPYVDVHDGPKRYVTFHLARSGTTAAMSLVLGVDGRRYMVVEGAVSVEVPADRAVHLSVHLEGDRPAFVSSMLLEPGTGNREFDYQARGLGGVNFSERAPRGG